MTKRLTLFAFLALGLTFMACQSEPKQETEAETTEEAQTDASSEAAPDYSNYNYLVEKVNSIVMWEGYKPGTTHNGTVQIKSGGLNVEDGQLTGGEIVMDMNTISVRDLKEGDGRGKLEAHLKGTVDDKKEDFFNVREYPEATLKITKVTALENDEEANTLIYGDLTIKGITKPVSFKAFTEETDNKFTARTPKFKVDRTNWDIKFMSKTFFDNLKDKFIEDEFGLTIVLVAEPQQSE